MQYLKLTHTNFVAQSDLYSTPIPSQQARLRARLYDLCRFLPKGSTITFLNRMDSDAFKVLMADKGMTGIMPLADGSALPPGIVVGSAWTMPEDECPGITLYHASGDVASYDFMEEFLTTEPEYHYTGAVVLGTQAGGKMISSELQVSLPVATPPGFGPTLLHSCSVYLYL